MKILQSVIRTLNKVEVSGKDNMDRLLASIQTLERLDEALTGKIIEEGDNGGNHDEQKQDVPCPVD